MPSPTEGLEFCAQSLLCNEEQGHVCSDRSTKALNDCGMVAHPTMPFTNPMPAQCTTPSLPDSIQSHPTPPPPLPPRNSHVKAPTPAHRPGSAHPHPDRRPHDPYSGPTLITDSIFNPSCDLIIDNLGCLAPPTLYWSCPGPCTYHCSLHLLNAARPSIAHLSIVVCVHMQRSEPECQHALACNR